MWNGSCKLINVLALRKFIPLLLLLLLAVAGRGQVIPTTIGPQTFGKATLSPDAKRTSTPIAPDIEADTTEEKQPAGLEYHEDIPDSLLQASVFLFHRLPMQTKFMDFSHPSLSPTGAQFYDIIDGFNGDFYLTAGEMGHPHVSLFPAFDGSLASNYRPCATPGFYKSPDNVNFYQAQHPYTVLSYNSSLKKDYQVFFTHSQNITPRWNAAFDYHLYSPTGVYDNDGAVDHLLDVTTNYYSRNARYLLTAGVIWQRLMLGENGGLSDDDIFIYKRISNPTGIPVNETSRQSLSNDLALFARQSYNTVRQVVWYRPIHASYVDTLGCDTLWHTHPGDSSRVPELKWRCELRDTVTGYDTISPRTPRMVNSGVFGLEAQYNRQKYRYIDSTRYSHFEGRLYWTNDAYLDYRWHNPVKLTLGIRPEMDRLEMMDSAGTDYAHKYFYPYLRTDVRLGSFALLSASGETCIGEGLYRLQAEMTVPLRDSAGAEWSRFTLQAVSAETSSDIIYELPARLAGTGITTLASTSLRKVSLAYNSPWFDISASASNVGRNVWFDAAYRTCQTTGEVLLLQAQADIRLQFWNWLHLDMQHMVQHSSDEQQLRVPLFATKNSFYTDFYLFHRALHTQVGVDMRYHTAFYADGYNPALGVFYRQDAVKVGNYLWADMFVNLQIKRATIYVKAGHLNCLLEPEAHYFLLPHYPGQPFGLFYGMTWKFFD